MSNRVPAECGLVFLVLLLLAGIGSCAPRGKGGGARGGTVANKAVVGEISYSCRKQVEMSPMSGGLAQKQLKK